MSLIEFILIFGSTSIWLAIAAWRIPLPRSAGLMIGGVALVVIVPLLIGATLLDGNSFWDVVNLSANFAPGARGKLTMAYGLLFVSCAIVVFSRK